MDAPSLARAAFDAWLADLRGNALDADPHFAGILARSGRDAAAHVAFASRVSAELDDLARDTNRDENLPRLSRYDGVGNRTEAVVFHPGYHELGRAAYGTGLMAHYREPGRELDTLATVYLLGQDGEAGHTCPLACTAGMIKILRAAAADASSAPGDVDPGMAAAWLDRLYDADYDRHFHGSQFLTEVQGGSDVGSNAVSARLDGDRWRLSGEKWFCSVADAHLFLVTARPYDAAPGTGGLAAFAVPRHRADGTPNGFSLRRLKYKLGTRSMASAEIDFQGAEGWRVGDFRRTVEIVLNTSRLYNAVVAAGMLQRAWREAEAYARHRLAFGRPIRDFAVIRRILAGLWTEACAARASTFWLAEMADRGATGTAAADEPAALRMLVNLNKIWTALTCPAAVRDAIEVLGGNGAIEDFSVLPRLLRDSIVVEAWEGGHGVLCAQLLRDSQRLGLHAPMFAVLERELGGGPAGPALRVVRSRWERVVEMPEAQAAWSFRDVVEALRVVVQGGRLAADPHPRVAAAGAHLLTTGAPGYDSLEDRSLPDRVAVMLGA